MTWEYASTLSDGPASKDTLNALGSEGWELVSVLQGTQTMQLLYVFKRPVTVPSAVIIEPADPTQQPEAPVSATLPELQF
ncbi:MAG: hypothetical protein ABI305_14290 [Tepidiformaceae bacterium]